MLNGAGEVETEFVKRQSLLWLRKGNQVQGLWKGATCAPL